MLFRSEREIEKGREIEGGYQRKRERDTHTQKDTGREEEGTCRDVERENAKGR